MAGKGFGGNGTLGLETGIIEKAKKE